MFGITFFFINKLNVFRILHKKGPEYTNQILNKAAVCIQKWVRGWLVRKELEKLKDTVSYGYTHLTYMI